METSGTSCRSISLIDALTRHLPAILLATLAGAAIAFGLARTAPPHWTAEMTMKLGQIRYGDSVQLLEDPMTTARRFSLPAFKEAIVEAMRKQDASHPIGPDERRLIFDTLRAVPRPGTSLIDLQVSGTSRELAQRAVDTAFELTRQIHQDLARPEISALQRQLADVQAQLAEVNGRWRKTMERLDGAGHATTSDAALSEAIAAIIASTINDRLAALKETQTRLTLSLSPLNTFDTTVMAASYVPDRPSTPKPVLYVLAGLALGLLAGVFWALLRSTAAARPPHTA